MKIESETLFGASQDARGIRNGHAFECDVIGAEQFLKCYGLYLCFASIRTGSSSFFKTNLAFHLFVQCHCTGKHTFVGIAQDKLSKAGTLFFLLLYYCWKPQLKRDPPSPT